MVNQKFQDAVVAKLFTGYYFDLNGNSVGGQSSSFLQSDLRSDGWKNLGYLSDFETMCEKAGFRVIHGKNLRGQKTRIITL